MTGSGEVTARSSPRMPFAGFVALAAGIVVALCLVGYLPTRRFVGDAAVGVVLAGGAVALVASLAGTVPLLAVRGRPPVGKVAAAMGSIAVRLAVVAVLATAVALSGLVDTKAFLTWVVVSHLGLLVADTLFARAEMRADDRSRGARESGGG
jgi:hypothetical protein